MEQYEYYTRKSYCIPDFYKFYQEEVSDNPLYQVDYKTYRAIVTDYFKYFRDEVIENGKDMRLPCRLGRLSIVKAKPKTYTSKSLSIDFHATKLYGKTIFHLNEHSNGFKYRAHWDKKNIIVPNKSMYQLVLSRANKRRLAYIIKNQLRDYCEI